MGKEDDTDNGISDSVFHQQKFLQQNHKDDYEKFHHVGNLYKIKRK